MRDIKFKYIFKGLPFSSVNSDFNWHVRVFTMNQIEGGVIRLGNFESHLGELVAKVQFTGLIDKNGVEIYEGDIVSGRDSDAEIKFFHGCWMAFYGEHKYFNVHFHLVELEVIGNIYQK